MKTLLLLRHAKSSWKDDSLADHDRPLNARGKRDAPRMGEVLRQRQWVPQVVISSTAKRARKTAKKVCSSAGFAGALKKKRSLYHAEPEVYLRHVHGLRDEVASAMLVGHNPGLEDLVEKLCGRYEVMPTAALAVFLPRVGKSFGWMARCSFTPFLRPKELPRGVGQRVAIVLRTRGKK